MDVPNPRCSLRAKALIGNIRAGIRPALGPHDYPGNLTAGKSD